MIDTVCVAIGINIQLGGQVTRVFESTETAITQLVWEMSTLLVNPHYGGKVTDITIQKEPNNILSRHYMTVMAEKILIYTWIIEDVSPYLSILRPSVPGVVVKYI